MKPTNKPAIGYCRFSPRPDADQSMSNERQEEKIRDYCRRRGYDLQAVFADANVSGCADRVHPEEVLAKQHELDKALSALKRGSVLVVVWRSRITRDTMAWTFVARQVKKMGASIETTDEPNGDTPEDELVADILSTFASYEAKKRRLYTAMAMRKHQKNGRRMTHGDLTPWGWKMDADNPANLVPNEEEIAVAEKIVTLRDSMGLSYYRIAGALKGTNRRGKDWWDESYVRKIYMKWKGKA